MKIPKLPKIDLIPGTDFDGLVVGIVGLALLYVGTGGWVEQRGKEAAATAGPAAGTLIWGKRKGEKEGFEKGYRTFNPELHVDEIIQARQGPGIAGRLADGVVNGVADAVVERAADTALDQLAGIWPGSDDKKHKKEPRKPPKIDLQQQADPRDARPVKLPDGWHFDHDGRVRDKRGRFASEERRRRALRKGQ